MKVPFLPGWLPVKTCFLSFNPVLPFCQKTAIKKLSKNLSLFWVQNLSFSLFFVEKLENKISNSDLNASIEFRKTTPVSRIVPGLFASTKSESWPIMSDSCENVLWRLFVSWKNACCPNMCQTCLLAIQYFILYFCQISHNSWPGTFFPTVIYTVCAVSLAVSGELSDEAAREDQFKSVRYCILSKKWWLGF